MKAEILIVEAHDFLREAIRNWLGFKFPECRIVEAASGPEALAIVQTTPPGVVVIDVALAGTNGLETVAQIKAFAPRTPVLVLTTFEDEIYKTYTANHGADAFLPKMKMITELQPILAALLSSETVPVPRKTKRTSS
jgi:DNA-binding NarL/FixJ family response regulator